MSGIGNRIGRDNIFLSVGLRRAQPDPPFTASLLLRIGIKDYDTPDLDN
jgi:hypothetical protein